MRQIGFSTGAIALDDFERALRKLTEYETSAVELSALRIKELQPLISAVPRLSLDRYSYISLHLPSSFNAEEERQLVDMLVDVPKDWLLILHPDSMHDYDLWRPVAKRIAIENMDRRKKTGRTAQELAAYFKMLPAAKFCFDIGHARQFDPSMAEAYLILTAFPDRLVQVHASEVDAQSRHAVITYAACLAFQEVAHLIPKNVPIILESRVSEGQIGSELSKVAGIFGS